MHQFLITTSKGLDSLLSDEIKLRCPDVSTSVKPGQVFFDGELEHAYQLCLWSRLANRVLLKLGESEIKHADDLYQLISSINWGQHFSVNNSFVIDFIGTNNEIRNSQFGALKVKDAIVDQFNDLYEQRPSVAKQKPDIRIQCRLRRNRVSVYLDLSGESLHIRHYRQRAGAAPIKENLASAMLMRSGWTNSMDKPLLDPMCGSATVAIEGALMAARIAPGLAREHWGFNAWKGHDEQLWLSLKDKALDAKTDNLPPIYANDIDPHLIRIAKENAKLAGVEQFIQFTTTDALALKLPEGQVGYLVSNPPYGERLSEVTNLLPVFKKWGEHLKTHFLSWHLSLLTSNRDLFKQLRMVAKKDYKLFNGTLDCVLVNYELDEKNSEIKPDVEISNDFLNRLNKNLQRLKKWKSKQDTNCYRVYDADLPEYNVAVDCYGDKVVVQEYAAPKNIPEHKIQKRMNDVILSVPKALEVDVSDVIVKTRQRQKSKEQYQKLDKKQEFFEVYENGAKFLVNLTDYLDTGLFLDHRVARKMTKDMSAKKDVLNLFAYTGSVSVFAALGGAKSVTTVDMSKTYLDWAKRNFALNGLNSPYAPYQFEQADCLSWLSGHNGKYDLIFVDPPSFSNSKRMDKTWAVQRDYLGLIRHCRRCLNKNGQIVFSNNLRNFKIDIEALNAMDLSVKDITTASIPEDFKRNKKIHNCWILSDAS
ncbi:bifunctional 23S rRNA (guanine(2069)-N(7))-methyltransferase RlmK/23S rRNA (guanine(2445)-N(2))-methyltransferase RlmL [Alteromonadaceae bacterium M269]|nr:bifunctional 23S rRNA (guanine(2069)-N(7))-methyltransferase RlmK/23S rRNA (guanine(2445)-N(2))-methyltransferase RlmL [Alteromonadaceae bacterium M269]